MPFIKGFLRVCGLFLFIGTIQAQPFAITITQPTNNSSLPPGDILIEASVTAPPGTTVEFVEFFANGLYIGDDAAAPYSILWTDVAEGFYVLVARAWDQTGDLTDSQPVVISVGGSGTSLSRGPYLQIGTPTSIIVRWRTSFSADSVVRYGLSADNLNQTVQRTTLTTEHEVPLT